MRKIPVLALALMLALSLAACGGDDDGGDNGGDDNSTPPGSQGGSGTSGGGTTTPGGGGFLNIFDEPLTVPETSGSLAEAVGVSVEGERIVRKYSDAGLELFFTPEGCNEAYTVYVFDTETGEAIDGQIWYGFESYDTFAAAFREMAGRTWEEQIRGYSTSEHYYGYYVLIAISDYDNDGIRTWDDAAASGDYESGTNYILIE